MSIHTWPTAAQVAFFAAIIAASIWAVVATHARSHSTARRHRLDERARVARVRRAQGWLG